MKTQKLSYWFKPIDRIFKDFKQYTLDYSEKRKRRIFIDRNADILLVAHLDTVLPPKIKKQTKKRIYAQGLDDRLGAMLAYTLSEKHGIDLLLTDNEEVGATTAQFHACKNYNWIVEFDRAGSDVVTYGLDSMEFLSALSGYWNIGQGSYSDICELNTKACCFNLGIGYERAHSKKSFVNLQTMNMQVSMFEQFYQEYKDIAFECDEKYSLFGEYEVCDICGAWYGVDVYGHIICEDCIEVMLDNHGVFI